MNRMMLVLNGPKPDLQVVLEAAYAQQCENNKLIELFGFLPFVVAPVFIAELMAQSAAPFVLCKNEGKEIQVYTRKVAKMEIGSYADFFSYDPGGIAGPATPRNENLEIQLFGKRIVETVKDIGDKE